MRILIVEDEPSLAEALGQIMKESEVQADVVMDGTNGLDYAMSGIYDVIVLDVMLPGLTGFEVVKEMRRQQNTTPVLLLTARDELADKITGLDSGADDYLTKPFSPDELMARLRALSRRLQTVVPDEIIFFDLLLNFATHTLSSGDKSVRLGVKEFEIIRLLLINAPRIVSKEDLLVKVWGMESEAEDNHVEVYISFLRKKLAYLGAHTTIDTVRKVGYHMTGSEVGQ